MARIVEAELERLKASVPVAGLIEASGVKLAQQGADLAGLCPFHAEDALLPAEGANPLCPAMEPHPRAGRCG